MKKLSAKQYQKMQRLQKKRWRRRLQRTRKIITFNKIHIFHRPEILRNMPSFKITDKKSTIFTPPGEFSLSANYDGVAAFILSLRFDLAHLQWQRRPFLIDFAQITHLGTTAALLIAAELDRWQRTSGRRLRAIQTESWDPLVRRQLIDLGFFSLLATQNVPESWLVDDGTAHKKHLIRFCTGIGTEGDQIDPIRHGLEHLANTEVDENRFYDGVIEAMANVAHHAYPNGVVDGIPVAKGRWWLTGSYDPPSRRIKASFLDQGIGIPKSLPRSRIRERIEAVLLGMGGSQDDSSRIQAAMEASRSSTESPERGHGLNDIRMFVETSPVGLLRIRSGKGEVTYRVGDGYAGRNCSIPLAGTIIEWEIRR